MSAQATTTDGTTWALARHYWAQLLTLVHTSWLRRDLVWAVLPAVLAAVLRPH